MSPFWSPLYPSLYFAAVEIEQQTASLACVTAWTWAKARDVLVEARVLGIDAEILIEEAKHRGPDGALELVARARAQVPELTLTDVRRAVHPFRVGNRLARRLGGRR